MKVSAVYKKGVFHPSKRVNLNENQKLVIHFWPEIKNNLDLEKAYAEASGSRPDLEDWNKIDTEGWI